MKRETELEILIEQKQVRLDSFMISNPITVSESDIKWEPEISANTGLSIDGIPSFGGPPPLILSSGMLCLTPSVSIIVSDSVDCTVDSSTETVLAGEEMTTSGGDSPGKEIAITESAAPITMIGAITFRFNFE